MRGNRANLHFEKKLQEENQFNYLSIIGARHYHVIFFQNVVRLILYCRDAVDTQNLGFIIYNLISDILFLLKTI